MSILCVRETLCDVYIICQESRLIGQPSIQDELYRRLDNLALDESLKIAWLSFSRFKVILYFLRAQLDYLAKQELMAQMDYQYVLVLFLQ